MQIKQWFNLGLIVIYFSFTDEWVIFNLVNYSLGELDFSPLSLKCFKLDL